MLAKIRDLPFEKNVTFKPWVMKTGERGQGTGDRGRLPKRLLAGKGY